MECSTQDEQIEKIEYYLRTRGHKGVMMNRDVAMELGFSDVYVRKLIQNGTLKSRDTRDVAAYIVLHT